MVVDSVVAIGNDDRLNMIGIKKVLMFGIEHRIYMISFMLVQLSQSYPPKWTLVDIITFCIMVVLNHEFIIAFYTRTFTFISTQPKTKEAKVLENFKLQSSYFSILQMHRASLEHELCCIFKLWSKIRIEVLHFLRMKMSSHNLQELPQKVMVQR